MNYKTTEKNNMLFSYTIFFFATFIPISIILKYVFHAGIDTYLLVAIFASGAAILNSLEIRLKSYLKIILRTLSQFSEKKRQ